MKTSAARALILAALAMVGLSCSENSLGVPRGGLVAVHLAPSFAQGPSGGPDIVIARLTGVLRRGVDSLVAEASILGDSAILEFQRVPVTGDSTPYGLGIQAFDSSNVLVFNAQQLIHVLSGGNRLISAVLQYSAPDTAVATLDVTPAAVALDWAGANANDNTCLNRAPFATAKTQQALTATGKTAAGQAVDGVRVGWTSRDTTVATVDDHGVVRSRCSNKSTWIVARTFLDKVDSAQVTVSAPAFALRMSPESTTVARGATVQLTAQLVDEEGNTSPAPLVNWYTSDATRATVSTTGLVTGVANGRVLITARSGDRTTIGVVQVVRPSATKVVIQPAQDSALQGQYRSFFARAYDAQGRVIPDATAFDWLSTRPGVATVSGGIVKAIMVDAAAAGIIAKIDGHADTAEFKVVDVVASGAIQGIIKDGVTDQGIAGAIITEGTSADTSGANGEFLLAGIHSGDSITVTASGYQKVTVYDVPVYSNDTLKIPPSPLAPSSSLVGTMTGKVVNALTGAGISGLTVKAYAGINAGPSPKRPNVQPNYTATTTSDGSYSMSGVTAGAYTFIASGTGYSESNGIGIAYGGGTKNNGSIILPPTSAGGGIYAVLTWGACSAGGASCDLDAHLTGPKVDSASATFHVYKSAPAYVAGDTIAALDVNSATGSGPEVISIRPSAPTGKFRFYVHDVAGGSTSVGLQSSSVRVDVYMDNRVVATFFPPSGATQTGNLWKVFDWDGARLTQVGEIVYQADVTGSLP